MSSDPIKRAGLTPKFWEKKALKDMNPVEWEALCDVLRGAALVRGAKSSNWSFG